MSDKAQKYIKAASELLKKQDYQNALLELDVGKTFASNNHMIYLLMSSCYLKLNQIDKMYDIIQEGLSICQEKDKHVFLAALNKYYEKKGMIRENVDVLSQLCKQQLKGDLQKLDQLVSDFAKNQLQWMSDSQFIEQINSRESMNEERNRVYSVAIDSIATKKLSPQTLELLFFLFSNILIKAGEQEKEIKEVVSQFKQIVNQYPTDLNGTILEESIFQLVNWLLKNNYVQEKNIIIYEIIAHFKNSTLALFYQLKFFSTNQGYVKKYMPRFLQQVYETIVYLYYPEQTLPDFDEVNSQYKVYLGEKAPKEEESLINLVFQLYDNSQKKLICEEFRIRAEIFLLYSSKFINQTYFKASTLQNLNIFEKRLDFFVEIYTKLQENADANTEIDDTIFCNPLFEAYILANYKAMKSAGRKSLLFQFKKTIDRLEQQQENVSYLKEIYNRWGLKIIDDQDELVMIKNNLKYLIQVKKDDILNLKVYYEYCIKLNKLYRIYDGSINLQQIIEQIIKQEPDNVYFKAEKWWVDFSNSTNKKEYYVQNISSLQNLKESAVLQNQKDVASNLQKRISILNYLFTSQSDEETVKQLEEAQKLDSNDYQNYVVLGVVYYFNGNIKEALIQFQNAFLYRQYDLFLNKMLFFCLHKLGQKQEAIDFLFRIYPAFKQIFWINRILGVYFSNIGDYKRATSYCQKALELYTFDKERNYRLHYEKLSALAPEKNVDIPHMIDYNELIYFDDYIIFNDKIYAKEAVNLSNNLIIDPQHRLHIKLCISLAQADKMQGKTCSSLSAIEEAEKVYLLASNTSEHKQKEEINVDEDDKSLKSELSKEVYHTLSVFSSVFLVSKHGDQIIKEYNLNDSVRNFVDALTINFEFAQITSYLQDNHKTYQRIRVFLVICYKVLEKIYGQEQFKDLEKTIFSIYEQMTGFILEMSLNFVQFHWKKYTLSSAQYLIEKVLQIKAPTRRSILVNVAFSEFYTLSGFINKNQDLIKNSIVYLKEILQSLSIDFESDIINNINAQKINSLQANQSSLFKYTLKNICLSYFYLYKINNENSEAYQISLKLCTAGILIFNLDIDFYNYYGLIEANEEIKIGAFIKSNRIQKNSLALDSLAFIYLKKGRYEEAANMLLKSIEVNTNNPTAYIGLFIIQYNMALAFNTIVQTGNDDSTHQYAMLQKQMIEKCSSYLHFVKQIEISASSVLFDGLLEFLNYHNERSHISYQFSTDLFDRAPYLVHTQLGQLYSIMILKQSSTREKKLEIFNQISDTIPTQNLSKLFISKSAELNDGFMQLVQNRILQEMDSIKLSTNKCDQLDSQQFVIVCREFDYLVKNLKLYLSLALYTQQYEKGLDFFYKQAKNIQQIQNISTLLQMQSHYFDLTPIYIQMTEIEYHLVQNSKPEEIDLVIKRLANLKNVKNSKKNIQEWPYSENFTNKIEQVSEYKHLQGIHSYKRKDYQKSKKQFYQALLMDPSVKEYRSSYIEYLITQQRFPMLNPYNNSNIQEQSLIIQLNNPNFSLKKKISHITKAAIYLDKPYLYYLLVHFQFEESSNYTPSRLIKLLLLLKTKVLNEKYDPEGVCKKKGIKLFMEIYIALEKMNSNDTEIKAQQEQFKQFVQEVCEANSRFQEYIEILNVFYKDLSSNEFVYDLQAILEKDRVSAYILAFNIIRRLIKEQKTNGMIQLLSALSQCIFTSVQEGLISQEVQKSNKGKILMNMLQHIDGYQYIMALQEDYREDTLYEKEDIQEMIHNAASYCYENYPASISMKFLYMQHLYRQENMEDLNKLLSFMNSTQFTSKDDDLITIFFYTLYYYYKSCKDSQEENIYRFVEYVTLIQDQYKQVLSSDLNTLLHFLQGVIYLKIYERRPDLDKKTIIKEFKQAILYSPQFAQTILNFIQQ
ncbi:tetratricopeptide repeat protein (macronuclear) [Tetrahymena thermophila SB210]|uniref:Tetratricopeptide repeat protein n=1 Tax=Tetrahymena thermophila (strain SB210) TaxID=312017 RepID=Q23MA4_TETTS|nr:tetratricopeptide repeat protein [Tetrahymena thermophila SB210]EAR97735.2 tetratricopeptide repeat protein [Tetrahymena thermophila SB210]|eukprot:XP_001017980.2 tetratricopeptide repeat protein [Tetrahymena thermophila SB210]